MGFAAMEIAQGWRVEECARPIRRTRLTYHRLHADPAHSLILNRHPLEVRVAPQTTQRTPKAPLVRCPRNGTLRWGVHPAQPRHREGTRMHTESGWFGYCCAQKLPKAQHNSLRRVCGAFGREASKLDRYLIPKPPCSLARTSLRGCLNGYAQPIVVTPFVG